MSADSTPLSFVFDGWNGYNTSLIRAIVPRTPEELAWRPAEGQRSVGEVAAHIALGRIDWFHRMGAPGAADLAEEAGASRGWQAWVEAQKRIEGDAAAIVEWLEKGWAMIDNVLTTWTVADLATTFAQPYGGKTYAVSRQWVLWRIQAHDIHHGGQLSLMLDRQGIACPDLIDNAGHIIEVPEMPA